MCNAVLWYVLCRKLVCAMPCWYVLCRADWYVLCRLIVDKLCRSSAGVTPGPSLLIELHCTGP